MDRVQPLRIMAGHFSDVDVSVFYVFIFLQSISLYGFEKTTTPTTNSVIAP